MCSVVRSQQRVRSALAAGALTIALGSIGCISSADLLSREDSLEETQRRYTELIRWGELERASFYVDPELVDEFLALASTMANLRITDFDSGEIDFGDHSAVVVVTYRGYSVSEFVERSARETQDWFREGGLTDPWRVRPQLQRVVGVLRGEVADATED